MRMQELDLGAIKPNSIAEGAKLEARCGAENRMGRARQYTA